MNLVLDRYADNPIIEALVCWPPGQQKVKSIRGCFPMIRHPFIEVETVDGELTHRHFQKDTFIYFWSEAEVIISAITDIELISEFNYQPMQNPQTLAKEVLEFRKECIEDSHQMFVAGMFQLFLDQYGANCTDLPASVRKNIAEAKNRINA